MKASRYCSLASLLIPLHTTLATGAAQTLEQYWPIHTAARAWDVITIADKNSPSPQVRLTVASKPIGPDDFELWFSNKPALAAGWSDVERYQYCANPGGRPWLFLESYMKAAQGNIVKSHPANSTRILFTPDRGQTVDLIADGTYARCGSVGQPYLLWEQDLASYRIQVWGSLTENAKWRWYWDATVTQPVTVTNDCVKPPQTVKALRVQESWWNNYKSNAGTWDLGGGDVGGDGVPTGAGVRYGRTVWHAIGQPYYMIGNPDGYAPNQCSRGLKPAE